MKYISCIVVFCGTVYSSSTLYAANEGHGVLARNPSPSPSGTALVFDADFDGPISLWLSNLDGGNLHKLTTNSGINEEPAWSPDGQRIAFASTSTGATDIWSIRPDGLLLTQLTSRALNNRQPAWSPNGQQIAFISDRGGTNDVWIMNADGTSQRRVTFLPGEENHPSFSPDGSRIVFSETLNGTATLMVINNDGSGLTALTTPGYFDWNPVWSVAGITFSSNRDPASEHWKFWRIQPTGAGLSKLADTIGLDPAILPNGHILFGDEFANADAVSAVTELDPVSSAKRIVDDVRGHLTPINVRPKSPVNHVNSASRGTVPVAILSTSGFDATVRVDRATITFGHSGSESSLVSCRKKPRDVNGDKLPDLVCRFGIAVSSFKLGDTVGILRFKDLDGSVFEGRDAVTIGSPDDPDDYASDCEDD